MTEDALRSLALTCPLCCSECGPPRFYKGDQPFYGCGVCGSVFQKPALNPNLSAGIEEFEGAYRHYLEESPEDRLNFNDLVRWMETFRPVAGTAIDLGTGSGKFPRYLRRRGLESYGLEPSTPLFRRYLASEPFFYNCRVEDLAAGDLRGKFDIVTAFDVLEHVEQPAQFLRDACVLLKSGGALYLSTPDVASAIARLSGKYWHFYNKWHLSFLPEPVITRIAASVGLQKAGVAHRGRLRSLRYMLEYLFTFALGRAVRAPAALDRVVLPINSFDTMYVCFQKPAVGAEEI